MNIADLLSNLTGPPAQPAEVEKEQEKAGSNASGDDWGDFDKYEDPNDVQFPTLQMTPRD